MSQLREAGLSDLIRITCFLPNGAMSVFQNVTEYQINEQSGLLSFYTEEGSLIHLTLPYIVSRLSFRDVQTMKENLQQGESKIITDINFN